MLIWFNISSQDVKYKFLNNTIYKSVNPNSNDVLVYLILDTVGKCCHYHVSPARILQPQLNRFLSCTELCSQIYIPT